MKIIQPEPKSDLEGLSDVLLGSLGLTGLITLGALLLGVADGGRDVLDAIEIGVTRQPAVEREAAEPEPD